MIDRVTINGVAINCIPINRVTVNLLLLITRFFFLLDVHAARRVLTLLVELPDDGLDEVVGRHQVAPLGDADHGERLALVGFFSKMTLVCAVVVQSHLHWFFFLPERRQELTSVSCQLKI